MKTNNNTQIKKLEVSRLINNYLNGQENYKNTLKQLNNIGVTLSYMERGKGRIKVMYKIVSNGTIITENY